MTQTIIGAGIGGLVTFLILVVTAGYSDKYLPAVIIGAIVTLLWPVVIGFVLVRRAKSRRDDQIQAEVERQMAEKTKLG